MFYKEINESTTKNCANVGIGAGCGRRRMRVAAAPPPPAPASPAQPAIQASALFG